mmetsp:Transcript_44144/g.70564  ORF Transcript_44144/g.70564 Transcript_44144/m.70564 type:complete len:459 (+) Transcript_44144:66-1442(+)
MAAAIHSTRHSTRHSGSYVPLSHSRVDPLDPQPTLQSTRSLDSMFESGDNPDEETSESTSDRINQVMGIVIMLNVLEVGAEHQWKESDYPGAMKIYLALDCVFAVLYSCEVAFGFATEKCNYWLSAWNVTNLVLTVLAIASIIADVTDSADLSGTEVLRMIRFVRLGRLLRLLTAIPDLVMVVEGLTSSLRSLSWVLFLLVIIMWVFGIFFTMTISGDYEDEWDGIDYFGDMAHSMMTLMDIAFLAEWGPVVRPVFNHQPYLLPFFIAFVLTSAFGMLNVIIGVIVDKTHQARKTLEDKMKQQQIKEATDVWENKIAKRGLSNKHIRQSRKDNNHDLADQKEKERAKVIKEIMDDILGDPNGIPFPHGLSADDVISLLDFDASGNLSQHEFVQGLKRLLLGDEFQLTCLTLTVMGKLRKEHADSSTRIEEQLTSLGERLERIEEKLAPRAPENARTDE